MFNRVQSCNNLLGWGARREVAQLKGAEVLSIGGGGGGDVGRRRDKRLCWCWVRRMLG